MRVDDVHVWNFFILTNVSFYSRNNREKSFFHNSMCKIKPFLVFIVKSIVLQKNVENCRSRL